MKSATNKLIKTVLTVIVFFTGFYISVNGQTNVSGFINANTTWNLAGSPYIVVGNVLVSYGFTLTIEPGVIIKFDHDKALQIDGKLIAIGTPANRITFTSNQTNPAPGDWAKIHFPDASEDAVFNTAGDYMSGSIMKYCNVFYGGGLGFGEIHVDMSSPYFNNCRIAYSLNSGIFFNWSYSWIDSSSIKSCTGAGLHLDHYELLQKHIFIRNDSIENNPGGGIYLGITGPSSYWANVLNCYFKGNQQAISANPSSATGHDNVKINNNIFTMNTGDVVSAGGSFISINCNRFINNTGKVINIYGPSTGTISHNIIDGNNSSGGNVITLTSATSPPMLLFSDNVVKNNTSNYSCLQIQPEITNSQGAKILNNEFTNNATLYTIYLDPMATPSGNFNFLDVRFNTLVNPLVQYEFYNNIPYGSSDVNIGNNYWGTANTQHIDSVIYDYFDFANQTVVYYTPLLTEPAAIDSACASASTGITVLEIKDFNFNLFPNPAGRDITMEWSDIINRGAIEIINMAGMRVYEENIFQTSKKQIDIRSFPAGVYFVRVTDDKANKMVSPPATRKPLRRWAGKFVKM